MARTRNERKMILELVKRLFYTKRYKITKRDIPKDQKKMEEDYKLDKNDIRLGVTAVNSDDWLLANNAVKKLIENLHKIEQEMVYLYPNNVNENYLRNEGKNKCLKTKIRCPECTLAGVRSTMEVWNIDHIKSSCRMNRNEIWYCSCLHADKCKYSEKKGGFKANAIVWRCSKCHNHTDDNSVDYCRCCINQLLENHGQQRYV